MIRFAYRLRLLAALTIVWSPTIAADAQVRVSVPDNSARILTPPAPATPRINGPSIFGVRPGSPLLYRVPVTGQRPMTYSARGLPAGVRIDPATGQLSGVVRTPGTYAVTLGVRNALGSTTRRFRLKVGDGVALTPPMGWNSYNVWNDEITQDRMIAAARAMVSSGLADHGWTYVNIDDGWQGVRGGPLNALQPDATRFPDIAGMVDAIHAMGLKVGIYSSPWVRTYANRLGGSAETPDGADRAWPDKVPKNQKQLPFAIGTHRFHTNDAAQFAAWGIDYLKYDWGPVEYPEAQAMFDALRAQPRDIVYSLSNNHVKNLAGDIALISTVANAWRTTTDIVDNWGRVANDIGFAQDPWARYARPGHYNDADMLVVGVVGWGSDKLRYTRLTPDEQYSHMSLWALIASPLLLGNDLTQLDPFTLSLLTNDEVIAVNQDALVQQATRVGPPGDGAVYRKRLEDGSHAVGLFNRGAAPAEVEARWSDLGIRGRRVVRDLWRQRDVGSFTGSYRTTVPAHGVALLTIR